MTKDSQLIEELERTGSRDEMQGRAHSKKEVEGTIFYRDSLKKCGRLLSKERRTQIYPSFFSKIISYTPRKKVTLNYCPEI